MRLPIYRKGTEEILCYAKEITITDRWMEESYASLVLDSPSYIDFSTGDYVIYCGRVYTFDAEHNISKTSSAYSTGNAFSYNSIRFDGVVNELKCVEMLDFSTDEINTHYSWLPTFSFYCKDVVDFANRLQANLDRSATTRGRWLVEISDCRQSAQNVQVSIDKENLFESIKKISTVFACSYSVKSELIDGRLVNKIVIEDNVPSSKGKEILSYGKGNGLVDIERQVSSDSKIVNKLHAYGGTDNMTGEYYSGRAVPDSEKGYRLISRDYSENYFYGIGWDARDYDTEGKTGRFINLRRRVVIDMPDTLRFVQKSSTPYEAKVWLRSRTYYYIEFDAEIPERGIQMRIGDQPASEDLHFMRMRYQWQDVALADIAHNVLLDSTDWKIFGGDIENNSLEIVMSHTLPDSEEEFGDNNTWCILRKDGDNHNEENLFSGLYDRVCLLGVKTDEQQYLMHIKTDSAKDGGWTFDYVEGSEKETEAVFHPLYEKVFNSIVGHTGCLLKATCNKKGLSKDINKADLAIRWLKYYGLNLPGAILNNAIAKCRDFDTSIYTHFRKMYCDTLFTDSTLAITRLMLPDFAYLGACEDDGGKKSYALDTIRDAEKIASLGGVVYIPFTSNSVREVSLPTALYYEAIHNCIGYREDGSEFEIKKGAQFYVVATNEVRVRRYDTSIEDSESIAQYGEREASVYFDTDDAANNIASVIPTFKGMYTDLIKAAGYEVSEHPCDNGYVDEVLGGSKPLGESEEEWDDGLPVDGNVQKKKGSFYFYIKDPGFNIANYANGDIKINFTSGQCEGREFKIANVKYVILYCKNDGSDVSEERGNRTEQFYGYRIECNRESDSSLGGTYFPNAKNLIHGVEQMTEKPRPEDAERELHNAKHSDTFVITGIFMPRVYVDVAAQRLKKYAKEYVDVNKRPRYTFTPKLNNIYLQNRKDVAASLVAGSRFYFDAAELTVPELFDDESSSLVIDSVTIKDGDVAVPEYTIVLKEVKEYTALQKLKMGLGDVEGKVITSAFMQSQSISTNESYISGMAAAFAESCLSKYDDDVAEGHITFTNGLTSNEVRTGALEVEGESVQEEIHSAEFEKGFKGHGLYKDDDGKWHFETDVLNVRGRIEANEIVVQESRHIGGEIMLTAAGCELVKVIKRDNGDFVCLYRIDDGVTIAGDNWEVGDQAFCEAFNVANSKVDETNYTQQRYWRLVKETGSGISIDAEYGDMRYIVLSGSDCEAGSTEPMAGDSVVQLGNRNNAEGRTGCTIISGAGTRMGNYLVFNGITGYSLPDPKVRISPDKVDITADSIRLVAGSEKSDLQQELERLNRGIESVDDMLDNKFDIYHIARESMKKDGEVYPSLTPVQMSIIDRDLRWDPSEYDEHIGDFALFSDGVCYRFDKRDGVYAWYLVTDAYLIDYVQKVTEQQRIFDAMAADDVISMQEKNLVKEILNRVDSEYITILGDAQYVGVDELDRTAFEQSASALIAMLTYVLNTNTDVAIGYNTESGNKLAVKFWPGQQIIGLRTYNQYDVAEVVPDGQSLAGWSDYNQAYSSYINLKALLQSETQRQTYQRSIEVTTSQEVINDILGKIDSLNREEASTKGTVTKMETGLGAFFTTDTAQWGVKNTSGLLTTSNFASLFASSTFTDGKQVAAQIAAYVNAEGSGIVLNADKIDFSSYEFNLNTTNISIKSVPFTLNNDLITINTENFKLSAGGDVEVNGTIRVQQLYNDYIRCEIEDSNVNIGSDIPLTGMIELYQLLQGANGMAVMPLAKDHLGAVVRIFGTPQNVNPTMGIARPRLQIRIVTQGVSNRLSTFFFGQGQKEISIVEVMATELGWMVLNSRNVEMY